jgi:hypothetical protein
VVLITKSKPLQAWRKWAAMRDALLILVTSRASIDWGVSGLCGSAQCLWLMLWHLHCLGCSGASGTHILSSHQAQPHRKFRRHRPKGLHGFDCHHQRGLPAVKMSQIQPQKTFEYTSKVLETPYPVSPRPQLAHELATAADLETSSSTMIRMPLLERLPRPEPRTRS